MNDHELEPLDKFAMAATSSSLLNKCGGSTPESLPFQSNTIKQEQACLMELMKPWVGTNGLRKRDSSKCWGYITSGGTEGVMKGVQSGISRLKRENRTIMVCYSAAAHYCVPKAVKTHCPDCMAAVVPVT